MNDHGDLSRRRFMLRVAQAGASLAAVGAVGWLAYDKDGPSGRQEQADGFQLPGFAVEDSGAKMAISHGKDRVATLTAALAAMGGIERFIRKGDCVLLKVNAAFATPPILSATSNPELVREIAGLCLKAGAREVRISDNPINDPDSCFRLTGIEEAAAACGARLMRPRSSAFAPFTLKGGALIRDWPLLREPLDGVNRVIGIAPVKDHHRSGASMTMKNWYGLLGGRRNIFHQDINTIISELATMMRPTLVVLDGTTTMMSNGPTGGSTADLKQTDTLIVSTDQVAADAFGATLLGRSAADLPYIGRAAAAGCGTADYKSLNPEEVNI
ncbi:MAG: DUF362 domain-containing protein [Candidatus Sumerlaeaceae bacterium]|nr:DUF362 domain-containing protein [Candidatus Sumerlaeaceae bacterium]